MSLLPGVAGTLFPGRFLERGLDQPPAHPVVAPADAALRRLRDWWRDVEAECGPATGLRALFDVAMPLFGLLGFRARDAVFDAMHASCLLQPGATDAPVALVILPWARRASHGWRDLVSVARETGADWGFVFAPPYLSLVPARGHATRHSVDFTFPDAFDRRSAGRLWTLASAAAFRANGGDRARIDRIAGAAAAWQDRVRDDLQAGVLRALRDLGAVVGHGGGKKRPAQGAFSEEALVLVYRILFLLFAESRDLVPARHSVYARTYSVAASCREALTSPDSRGLWDGLAAVTRLSRIGCESADLIVSPFNGRLFARASAPSLEPRRRPARPTRASDARDAATRSALIALGSRAGAAGREEIDYADLGVEQLGAVYERLLDVGPSRQLRKETGTFYTPRPLAEFLVRRTLAPILASSNADAILELRVVDPAMGSGAFLVAACHHLAAAYERALVEEGRVSAADLDERDRADFRRLIAERCLAGVDANPIAVQLARLSLWLATLARGKPLTFLDHRLRAGNSLIGASPDNLARTPSRSGAAPAVLPLFDDGPLEAALSQVCRPLQALSHRRDDTVGDVRIKDALWRRVSSGRSPVEAWRLAASVWCARWFWPAGESPSSAEIRAVIDAAIGRPSMLPERARAVWTARARDLATRHRFFHWPLEFPDVFYDEDGRPRPRPGFDVVIGNPPWEMLRRDGRTGQADERAGTSGPSLVRFVRESGLYPACAQGHVNMYQPFLDRMLSLVRDGGRFGVLLPWGLAADEGAAALRRRLLDRGGVDTIVGLHNGSGLFPIHRGLRFVAIAGTGGVATRDVHARFGVKSAREIEELPAKESGAGEPAYPVRLTAALIRDVGGASARIPDVRDLQLLELLRRLTRELPPLGSPGGWHATFGRELNATEDRGAFGTAGLPIIEGKHLSAFAVHVGDTSPRLTRMEALRRWPDARFDRPRLAYRDVSAVTNRRTLVAAIVPAGVLTTHTLFCLRTPVDIVRQHYLCALLNSFVVDALVRMLMGGHLTTALIEGLPVPLWRDTTADRRLARLSARVHTADDPGHPAALASLQAGVAQRYGLSRSEFEAVLRAFPLVGSDEKQAVLTEFTLPATRPA